MIARWFILFFVAWSAFQLTNVITILETIALRST